MANWEEKFLQLEAEHKLLQNKAESLEQDVINLNKQIQSTINVENESKNEHSGEFWKEVYELCLSDPDAIKTMIKNKTITLKDTDTTNRTILHMAAKRGAYQLAQFCINSGADLHAKNDDGLTPLDLARQSAYYNVEQLLLFAELNVNVGNEIRNISEEIHKQNGIIGNILSELVEIGQQSKELFERILMELMINIINKQLSFSDNLLNLCWNIACRDNKDPLSSDLWKAISTQSNAIIQNGSKRDWYWLKKCLLPSTV